MSNRHHPDAYLPATLYSRILTELAAVLANQALDRHLDPQTFGVELLGLAGVWPDSCAPVLART